MLFIGLALLLGTTFGQRPADATICDYYTVKLYGSNTTESQNKLMQGIISMAWGGGAGIPNTSDITGILNPGTFQGTNLNLGSYFDGSKASSNLNNVAVGINWLDGGGTQPLNNFLNSNANSIVLANNTNQYRLLSHWTFTFSRLFGCTQPKPLPSSESRFLSPAYVHKYMKLNNTEVGHFIDQLTKASTHFGFSEVDRMTLSQSMNVLYNVRCSPAKEVMPSLGPQLYSICQDESCPLDQPIPNCAAYSDIQPSISKSGGPASSTGAPTSTSATSSTTPISPNNLPITSSSPSPSSAATLSPGGIAGAVIGGSFVLLSFIGLIIFLLRRRSNSHPPPPSTYNPDPSDASYASHGYNDHHASVLSGQTAHVEQWMQEAPPTPYIAPVEMDSGAEGMKSHASGMGYGSPSPVSPHLSQGNMSPPPLRY
ncbi:hypothetical protein HYFRA_00006661 [Hymenoscyphus fraxineus]|uniref:Uncharacterized protein n=1 Tax=Hymenoscyphus fraxineus TaxID=746836 RepID=A0A9N9KT69_9HELO|nr:hypothetical protein HYFRA_00006661 [Hymenoscyphus fraxineus]